MGQLFVWLAFELCHALVVAITQLHFSHNDLHTNGNFYVYSGSLISLTFNGRSFQSRQAHIFWPKICDFDQSSVEGMEWQGGIGSRHVDTTAIHSTLSVLKLKMLRASNTELAASTDLMLREMEANGFKDELLDHELF